MIEQAPPPVEAPWSPATARPIEAPAESLRWFERVGLWAPSVLLVLSSIVMAYAYLCTPVLRGNTGLTNLTESYGALERVALWQRTFDWLPGARAGGRFVELEPWVISWSARASFAGMFLAHAWAFWLIWKHQFTPTWQWLVGPVLSHLVMILLVPSNADVFFYEMTGDLAANDINPYVYPLMDFPSHPLLPYNHWIEMTAVYGPVWTGINSVIMSITGPDPAAATIAYKVVLGIVALALAGLCAWFVQVLTHRRHLATAAGVLVAWQPNLIVESTGQAHNDPLVILLATAGIFLAIAGGTRAIRGGLVLITLSVLVKYVTLPILGLLGLVRLVDRHHRNGLRGVLGSWVLDTVTIVAVMVAAFGPFWAGFGTIKQMLLEPGRLYTNPLWFDPYMLLDLLFPHRVAATFADITRPVLQLVTVGLALFVVIRFVRSVWEIADEEPQRLIPPAWTTPLLSGWALITSALALIPVNSHPWYWTWPIVPIAILVCHDARGAEHLGLQPRVPRWFWGYLTLTALMTLAYHTRIVHI
jgi:hypothetical protein